MGRMNGSERTALRQVVRQRMKVLRSDVAARKAELEAEIGDRITTQFAGREKLVADLNDVIAGIVDQASKDVQAKVEQVCKDHEELKLTLTNPRSLRLAAPEVTLDATERYHLRRQLLAELEAQVAAAMLSIERQEADLIQELCVDGLETEAAKNFLGRIPTVGELVPASRMWEITGP